MDKVSIIIPAFQEPYLQYTIDSLLLNAKEDIEIIVALDGYWPDPAIKDDDRVILIHTGEPKGMRSAINSAARIARGKYLMKCDAHCAFATGYDVELKSNCKPDWTVVPVRYSLDSNTWKPKPNKKYEFEYISSDDLKGRRWPGYAKRVGGNSLPELMTMQGSCWFMHRERFWELDGLDEINYGGMGREAQEISLKSWLSGGRVILNRNTWYAHWSKSKNDIRLSRMEEKQKSVDYASDLWLNDKWPKQTRSIRWLADRFAPVPTWEELKTENTENTENSMGLERHVIKGIGRAGMYQLFAEWGLSVGCEVGVQRGRNARVMLDNIPGLTLHLVEPYKDHTSGLKRWGDKNHRKFRRMARKRLRHDNVIWHQKFSEQAAFDIPDGSLDFCYIDADHTYDFFMVDLIIWTRKVRPGGIVSGHDFDYRGRGSYKARVMEAIEDYARQHNITKVWLTDKKTHEHHGDKTTSWFFKKK